MVSFTGFYIEDAGAWPDFSKGMGGEGWYAVSNRGYSPVLTGRLPRRVLLNWKFSHEQ